MDPVVRKALLWVLLGSAVLMTGFTGLDLASGVASTALWLALFFWPLVVAICWWILASDKSKSADETGTGESEE